MSDLVYLLVLLLMDAGPSACLKETGDLGLSGAHVFGSVANKRRSIQNPRH